MSNSLRLIVVFSLDLYTNENHSLSVKATKYLSYQLCSLKVSSLVHYQGISNRILSSVHI